MMAFVLVFMGACQGSAEPKPEESPTVTESPAATETATPTATETAAPVPTDTPVAEGESPISDDYIWYAFCMPVVDEDAFRTFCNDIMSNQQALKAYGERNGKLGEWVFLQTNPDGAQFAIMVQHARPSFMSKLLASEDEFDKWIVEGINTVSGMNLAEMLADPAFRPNQMVFDVTFEEAAEGHAATAFAAPLAPGMTDTWLALCKEIETDRIDAYMDSRKALGFSREGGWLQRMPEMDLVIIVQVAADNSTTMAAIMESESEFDVWFRDNFFAAHGWNVEEMTEENMPKPNELVLDWWFAAE
jgi:hypothetical protein